MSDLARDRAEESPVVAMMLALGPSLAITTHTIYPIILGIIVTVTVAGTSSVMVLLRDVVSRDVYLPVTLVVMAGFASIADLLLRAYAPDYSVALGIYVPLVAVNGLILTGGLSAARTEFEAPGDAVTGALRMGVGFTAGLTLIALIREVIGQGSVTLVPFGSFDGVLRLPFVLTSIDALALPVGGFLIVGYVAAFDAHRRGRSGGSE